MTTSGQFVPLRAACVVPAYNAAETLEQVIDGVRQTVPRVRVVVVDDGSTDQTREVADRVADDTIGFDQNRGKGAALRAGFEAALAERCSTVLTIDADGQHDPAYAPALFSALTRVDVVIGVRKRNGSDMPLYRRLSNALSSAAVSACTGRRFTDSQSGFRAVRAEVLRRIDPAGDRYEYETDFLIQAARGGWRIGTVPVSTLYGEWARSHFRTLGDSARVVWTICRRLGETPLHER
jgi:glycosyltransferase involved in cell wall biosynthesis